LGKVSDLSSLKKSDLYQKGMMTMTDHIQESGTSPCQPEVTAIIPTRGRPQLLKQAIQSILDQQGPAVQIQVIIDGPRDMASEKIVEDFKHPLVKFHAFETNKGPAACRTAGALMAETEWVAFLDDDDLWYPQKIQIQLAAVPKGAERRTIVSCRSHIETPTGIYVWPRRLPAPGQKVGDYLFCRRSLFKGDSFVQASSILCHRDVMVQFPQRTVAHEDWDWLIRACDHGGCRLIVVPEILARHKTEFKRNSLSNLHQFNESFQWSLDMSGILSKQAFSGFLLHVLNGMLTERGDWRSGCHVFVTALRHGKPRIMDLFMFGIQWLFPTSLRRRIRSRFQRLRPGGGGIFA
jgi:glycosyltransferase involved in cell wall biosynthesis